MTDSSRYQTTKGLFVYQETNSDSTEIHRFSTSKRKRKTLNKKRFFSMTKRECILAFHDSTTSLYIPEEKISIELS